MNEWVIDIGNTDLVIGIWSDYIADPQTFRLKIRIIREDHSAFKYFFENLIQNHVVEPSHQMIMSSVVPDMTDLVLNTLKKDFSIVTILLNINTYNYLPLKVLRPDQIGSDLVANALAAHLKFQSFSIIADFGTALSFTTLDPNGKILGVCIAPGLQTAIKSLTAHTAQLYEVPINQPDSVLGQNTEHAIQAGITYGYDGLVKGIVMAQEKELGHRLNLICTGGLSKIIKSLDQRVDHFFPFLTLEGLRAAGKFISQL